MKFSNEQIERFLQSSKAINELHIFADRVGFEGDFPNPTMDQVIWFLEAAQLGSLDAIDSILTEHRDTMQRFITDVYVNRISRWRITEKFICELALILKYPQVFTEESLVEGAKWDRNIASLVIAAAKRQELSVIDNQGALQ